MQRDRTPLPDPPVTDLCATCHKPRQPEKANTRTVRQLAELDAFCSSTCCREWHGTQLPQTSPGGAPSRQWKHGSTAGYRAGCKCDDCTTATRNYKREYRTRTRTEGDAA